MSSATLAILGRFGILQIHRPNYPTLTYTIEDVSCPMSAANRLVEKHTPLCVQEWSGVREGIHTTTLATDPIPMD